MTTRDEWQTYTKPSDETLLTVCLGDLAMSNISDGDKAVVDTAIRVVKREAALVEKLKALIARMERDFDPCPLADELSALLKEAT